MILLRVRYTRHKAAQKKKTRKQKKKLQAANKKNNCDSIKQRKARKSIIVRLQFPLPLVGFPIQCTRSLLGWGFKRFRYPFKLQVFPATVGFQIKDFLTAFIDICFSLVRFLSYGNNLFLIKRLLLFFNGHDVGLYIGYFSLKTLHCLIKVVHWFFHPASLIFR